MSELRAAAITLARALEPGGIVFCVPAGAVEGSSPLDLAPFDFSPLNIDSAEIQLRALSRPGDAVLVVGDFAGRDRLLRRCPAWGVASVWVGTDDRPEPGLATVCLLVPDQKCTLDALVGQMRALAGDTEQLAPEVVDCTDEVCITCSDEGRLGEVVFVQGGYLPARVRTATGVEEVDLTLVGDLMVNELILIHAGSAIAVVPEAEPEPSFEPLTVRGA
ncbi:hypothetical protein KPL76_10175 [Subtercola sp. PAMC28395]|uniref:hypothetical protein n=1 Tax=Subtercola sp. PAMC28395 TaxID=2846775 RepID=UPI001C0BA1ED|nr:hypothetical protein [Subtercola sp. PAMC28395]QWT23115.1 hypothetical protein KPL76_10175 [Subtercola sp. PAMC28395]